MFTSCRLRSLLAGALTFSTLLIANPAPADTADAEFDVLVPGSRLQQTPSGATSISVITADMIAASPAQTVADLLTLEAGVDVRSLFGNYAARATVDVRGFGVTGGQNTLILLDGRRLNDVDTSGVNFAALPLSNIERIEVIRGSGAVLYGSGASGGVINVVTRRPQVGEFSAEVGLTGGSYDTAAIEGRLSHGGERTALSLTVDSIDSDGYRDNNKLRQRNAQAELRFDGAAAEFYAKAGWSDQDLGLPGVRTVDPNTNLNELATDRRGTITPDDYAQEQLAYLTLGVSRPLGNSAGFLFDIGYRDRQQQGLFVALSDYLDTTLRTTSVTPRFYVDHSLLGASGRLVAGIDFYDYDYDSARAFTEQTVGTPIHRLLIDQRNTAFYLSNVSQPTDRLNLDLGARIERVRFEAQDVFNPAAPGAVQKFEFTGAPDFARSDTESLFEAGLGYTLAEDASLFLRAGRSVRFGTLDDLYEYDAFFSRIFSPLEPQVARHLEVELRLERGLFDGTLTAYAMELKNEIHFNPVSFANENLDPTRRRGIEAELGVQATENLSLRANITAQRATFREGPFDGNDVPVAPRRMANLSLLWTIIPNVKLATTWHYVGEKRFDNDEANNFASRIPAYDTIDAKLMTQWNDWTVSASLRNLLDEEAYDYGVASTFTPGRFNAYPLPERNFSVGVSRSFK